MVCKAWSMTKRRALWLLCALVAGLSLLVGGIIVGVSVSLVKNPPAPLVGIGDWVYVHSLNQDEREEIITGRLTAMASVHSVRVLPNRGVGIWLEIRMDNADQQAAQVRAVKDVCFQARLLWDSFEPVKVDCTVLSVGQ